MLIMLVIGGSILPTYAAQLDVVIPKNSEEINPTFQDYTNHHNTI